MSSRKPKPPQNPPLKPPGVVEQQVKINPDVVMAKISTITMAAGSMPIYEPKALAQILQQNIEHLRTTNLAQYAQLRPQLEGSLRIVQAFVKYREFLEQERMRSQSGLVVVPGGRVQ